MRIDTNNLENNKYVKAVESVEKLKEFYQNLISYCLVIPFLIFINLQFSSGFHWFWFPVMGIILVTFIHWMIVFGSDVIGYGKDWEERKIDEYIKKNK